MTLLESSPAASALLQLVAEELLRNKRKGLCFPISHGLLWWSSTTTTDHRADVAELHHICPRSALAVLPQRTQTAVELHRSLLLFSAIPVAEELFSNGDC
jgi:hypothetical protein